MGWGRCEPPEPADVTKRKAPAERWKLPILVVEQLTEATYLFGLCKRQS